MGKFGGWAASDFTYYRRLAGNFNLQFDLFCSGFLIIQAQQLMFFQSH
jgi:hypothetical protein